LASVDEQSTNSHALFILNESSLWTDVIMMVPNSPNLYQDHNRSNSFEFVLHFHLNLPFWSYLPISDSALAALCIYSNLPCKIEYAQVEIRIVPEV
jgi:hypothetical protein